MKQPIYSFIIVLALFSSTVLSSCKKLVTIDAPKNQLITSTVFADSADATAAVVGIYVNIMKGVTSLNFANGALTVYTGFSADEIYPASNIASESEFYENAISATNNNLNASLLWKPAYQFIYQANACIEGLTKSTTLSSGLKNQLLGEAKFARAFFYFYLVGLYGDVPLVTSTDFATNATLSRTSTVEIYKQMIADVTEAKDLLSDSYVTPGRVRPNRFTALAVLSRIYLYQGQWAKAEEVASEIINSGTYQLEPNLNNVFLPASKETIWQMIPLQPGFETAEGYKFIPGSATIQPKCVVTDYLLAAFDSGDNRRQQWLSMNTINNVKYYYPYKYHLGNDGNTTPKEYYVALRLAEQYLIRAEARAHQNNIQGAVDDLNLVRLRAGLGNTTANDQATILKSIMDERQVELFCEWGHRWFDLKRTGTIDAVLSAEKPEWQSSDALYPVPFTELQSNPKLTQNPGY